MAELFFLSLLNFLPTKMCLCSSMSNWVPWFSFSVISTFIWRRNLGNVFQLVAHVSCIYNYCQIKWSRYKESQSNQELEHKLHNSHFHYNISFDHSCRFKVQWISPTSQAPISRLWKAQQCHLSSNIFLRYGNITSLKFL